MKEFDLLKSIFEANSALGARVLIPPGDDMGMVQIGDRRLLAAVDQLVAGRHVNVDVTPLHLVGRKAITRSLSDIAAMAAEPIASLVAATLPPDFGADRAAELFEAMRSAAASYDCPLIGGDLAFHSSDDHPLTCSVTVLAEPGSVPPVRRSGAQVGDTLYVTGRLGGSLQPDGLGRHLTFEPRIREALELARQLGDRLHAMIDISDGLGRDASHIACMSGVAIVIDAARVPCHAGVAWRRALGDGEDYELCFTAAGPVLPRLADLAVTAVGRVVPREPSQPRSVSVSDGARTIGADELGWQHEA